MAGGNGTRDDGRKQRKRRIATGRRSLQRAPPARGCTQPSSHTHIEPWERAAACAPSTRLGSPHATRLLAAPALISSLPSPDLPPSTPGEAVAHDPPTMVSGGRGGGARMRAARACGPRERPRLAKTRIGADRPPMPRVGRAERPCARRMRPHQSGPPIVPFRGSSPGPPPWAQHANKTLPERAGEAPQLAARPLQA